MDFWYNIVGNGQIFKIQSYTKSLKSTFILTGLMSVSVFFSLVCYNSDMSDATGLVKWILLVAILDLFHMCVFCID